MFDGIEVRRIRRQKEEVAPSSFDELFCFGRIVKGGVIPNKSSTSGNLRKSSQALKTSALHPLKGKGGYEPLLHIASNHTDSFSFFPRYICRNFLTSGRSSVNAKKPIINPGLIQKRNGIGIQLREFLLELGLLLGTSFGVKRRFLRSPPFFKCLWTLDTAKPTAWEISLNVRSGCSRTYNILYPREISPLAPGRPARSLEHRSRWAESQTSFYAPIFWRILQKKLWSGVFSINPKSQNYLAALLSLK